MSLSTIWQDVESWASEAGTLIGDGVSAASGIGGDVKAAASAIDDVSKMFTALQAYYQTPTMVNASEAQKLQAFKDRVSQLIASRTPQSEMDLEKLEGDS